MIAATQVGVQPRRQHLRQHTGGRAAAMHPAHEAWMHVARRIRQDVPHELLVYGSESGRRGGKAALEPGSNLLRNRLPHRTFSNILYVVEHVVEHTMAIGPETRPIRRVERRDLVGWWDHAHTLNVTLAVQ